MSQKVRVKVVGGQLLTSSLKAFESAFYMPEQLPTDDGWLRASFDGKEVFGDAK